MDLNSVKIGSQIWTSHNLMIKALTNGTLIQESKNIGELKLANKHKIPTWHYCSFNSDLEERGLYYNKYAFLNSNFFPEGWHIPNKDEWERLFFYCGFLKNNEMPHLSERVFDSRNQSAIERLKSKSIWSQGNHKGNNQSGFNALPDSSNKFTSWWFKEESKLGQVFFGAKPRQKIAIDYGSNDYIESAPVRLLKNNEIIKNKGFKEITSIGSQKWMTKNLDTLTFNNGDSIPLVNDADKWLEYGKMAKPACCYYEGNEKFQYLGLLYNFNAINDPRGLAPKGQRIASSMDFLNLKTFMAKQPENDLNLLNSDYWNLTFETGNRKRSTNEFNFGALAAGSRNLYYVTSWEDEDLYKCAYSDRGENCSWWTIDGSVIKLSFYRDDKNKDKELPIMTFSELILDKKKLFAHGLSIRCLQM